MLWWAYWGVYTLVKTGFAELLDEMNYPFLGGNVFDTEWDEPVFESTSYFEKGGVQVAVIGQHFPILLSLTQVT